MSKLALDHTAKRLYDSRARSYEDSWHPDFARVFVNLAGISPGQRVLDLACGTGLVTALAAAAAGPQGSVTAVDASPDMLAVASEKQNLDPEAWANVKLLEGDILHLDDLKNVKERRSEFAVITMASAFVLMHDPLGAARYFLGYLKPGGKFIVDSTHPDNLLAGSVLEDVARRMRIHIPYYRAWSQSEDSLRGLLTTAGFCVECVTVVQQVGYGVRSYHSGPQTADKEFDKMLFSEPMHEFHEAGRLDEARALFREEWAKRADRSGQVKEVDQVFVAIARRPLDAEVALGSCRCGNIAFTSSSLPTELAFCHCRTCQKLSGAGYMAFLQIQSADLTVDVKKADALRTVNVTAKAERDFCAFCGTTLFMRYRKDDIVSITLSSVDRMMESIPELLKKGLKTKHIFMEEKADWEILPEDGIERFDGFCGSR